MVTGICTAHSSLTGQNLVICAPFSAKQDERLGNRVVTVGIEQQTSTTGAGHVDSAKNQVLLPRKKGKWFLFIDNSLGHSSKVCLALR